MPDLPPKPEPLTLVKHDYNKCRDYLEAKYGYHERDVLGRFRGNPDAEYLDFWHWVVDNYEVRNESFMTFSRSRLDGDHADAPEWVRKIYGHYLEEFADANGEVHFYVWW